MKLLLCTILALLFLPVASLPAAAVPRDRPRLRSVQADFVQEKHLKILARPIRSTGRFVFQAPASLRWEYRQPVRSLLLLHNGRVRRFSERQGRLVEEQGMGLDTMQLVLAEIENWIQGRFTENRAFRVSQGQGRTIVLTPRQDALSSYIRRIELEQGDRPGLLRSVTIVEGEDAFTRLTFSNAVLNHPVPAKLFTAP